MGQKGIPTYTAISRLSKSLAARRATSPVSTASAARSGATKYSSSIIRRACIGLFPAASAQVTGLSGRTPVSMPQGGAVPSTSRAARKKQRPMACRR